MECNLNTVLQEKFYRQEKLMLKLLDLGNSG